MKIRASLTTIVIFGMLGTNFSAHAQILYGADGSGHNPATQLYTIDPTTGIATAVGAIGFAVTGLAWDSATQTLYGGTTRFDPNFPGEFRVGGGSSHLITIDIVTGAGTLVGAYNTSNPAGNPESMADLAIDSTGRLFSFLEPNSDDLYTINKFTGAATLVGDSPSSGKSAIAFDSLDNLFFSKHRIHDPGRHHRPWHYDRW